MYDQLTAEQHSILLRKLDRAYWRMVGTYTLIDGPSDINFSEWETAAEIYDIWKEIYHGTSR